MVYKSDFCKHTYSYFKKVTQFLQSTSEISQIELVFFYLDFIEVAFSAKKPYFFWKEVVLPIWLIDQNNWHKYGDLTFY